MMIYTYIHIYMYINLISARGYSLGEGRAIMLYCYRIDSFACMGFETTAINHFDSRDKSLITNYSHSPRP